MKPNLELPALDVDRSAPIPNRRICWHCLEWTSVTYNIYSGEDLLLIGPQSKWICPRCESTPKELTAPMNPGKTFNLGHAIAGKPIMFRDGSPARFIHHLPEAALQFRVIVFAEHVGRPVFLPPTGRAHPDRDEWCDLFMAPEIEEIWLNVYPFGAVTSHPTRAEADRCAKAGRLACKLVEFEEGDGLNRRKS